jgi:hypothetical protein
MVVCKVPYQSLDIIEQDALLLGRSASLLVGTNLFNFGSQHVSDGFKEMDIVFVEILMTIAVNGQDAKGPLHTRDSHGHAADGMERGQKSLE